jgi:hypothetical protein
LLIYPSESCVLAVLVAVAGLLCGMPCVFADLLFFHARYIESSFGVAIVVLRRRLLLGEHDVCSAVSICLVVCEGFLRCF